MLLRFLKWLMVALIAAAVVLALEHALRSETGAAALNRSGGDYQNAVMAAMPCAPACHASASTASVMPPMA